MTQTAIYARFSTDKQDARSIDDQARRCERFASERKLTVVETYKDAAQSGASLHRAGFQRMLADAKRKRFSVVLVDDLSRLSRDLGDTWNIVFGDLAAAGVRVIDCTTGQASDSAGARLTFGAMALVNDTFLQLVRSETHRGLEGRAKAGFWTGGACYGYRTAPEECPPDPDHPRSIAFVHEPEAKVVRSIFQRYGEGVSLGALVDQLNRDGVAAPGTGRGTVHGWSKSQLHALLRNERYLGLTIWNRREWYRDPVTKKRRSRERPESAWVRTEQPELAIIERDVWEKVQGRHKRNQSRATKDQWQRHEHLLSGLLRCGTCGSPMTIVGSRVVEGRTYCNFGCSARHAKGPAVCQNDRTISEKRINEAVLATVADMATSPVFESWVLDAVEKVEQEVARETAASNALTALEAEIQAQEAKVARVADAIIEVGTSAHLKARLLQEEEKLRDLRGKLAKMPRASTKKPRGIAQRVLAEVRALVAAAQKQGAEGRRALQAILEPVLMVPTRDGYRAEIQPRNGTAAPEGGHSVMRVVAGAGFEPATFGL